MYWISRIAFLVELEIQMYGGTHVSASPPAMFANRGSPEETQSQFYQIKVFRIC